MLRYLHLLSAVLFYILGASFFTAYVLVQNRISGSLPLAWLSYGILPLLLSGMLYGGLSIYRSLQGEKGTSKILLFTIGLPLFLVFVKFLPPPVA